MELLELLAWRIGTLGGHTTPEKLIESLSPTGLDVELPAGGDKALAVFRKSSSERRERYAHQALSSSSDTKARIKVRVEAPTFLPPEQLAGLLILS
jgi:hypothetical protein